MYSSIPTDEPPEFQNHSFIIRIWLEEEAAQAGKAAWRGHITHVPSHRRQYVQDLKQIVAFIVPYLDMLGVDS